VKLSRFAINLALLIYRAFFLDHSERDGDLHDHTLSPQGNQRAARWGSSVSDDIGESFATASRSFGANSLRVSNTDVSSARITS